MQKFKLKRLAATGKLRATGSNPPKVDARSTPAAQRQAGAIVRPRYLTLQEIDAAKAAVLGSR